MSFSTIRQPMRMSRRRWQRQLGRLGICRLLRLYLISRMILGGEMWVCGDGDGDEVTYLHCRLRGSAQGDD